ncbi:MAG: N-acetylmuramoyl-L-alanine amidase [Chthoniobacteraceae bacterium]
MRSNIASTVSDIPRQRKALAAFFLLGAACWLGGCASGTRVKDTTKTFDTVVIDAGHGGHDSGARSRWAGREKSANLDVAKRLEPKLRAAGFRTVMTRNTDDFIALSKRAKVSNGQRNALFVSIHFNDCPKRSIRGTEVYYRSPVSRPVAERILAQIDAQPNCSARYVKSANFYVLRKNEYPAVLVECGYLSNRSEGSLAASGKHRERLAGAIADALIDQRGREVPKAAPIATASR